MKIRDLLGSSFIQGTSLLESPEKISPTDFDLHNERKNKELARELLSKKKETFEETDEYILFLTGDKIKGYIALYDKAAGTIDYIIRYSVEKKKFIGKTVSQIALWRKDSSPFTQGITTKVFFQHLLSIWPAVLSDQSQTDDGAAFWRRTMAAAVPRGFKVGLADTAKQTVDWFSGSNSGFKTWLDQRKDIAWGDSAKFRRYRFIISNQ